MFTWAHSTAPDSPQVSEAPGGSDSRQHAAATRQRVRSVQRHIITVKPAFTSFRMYKRKEQSEDWCCCWGTAQLMVQTAAGSLLSSHKGPLVEHLTHIKHRAQLDHRTRTNWFYWRHVNGGTNYHYSNIWWYFCVINTSSWDSFCTMFIS